MTEPFHRFKSPRPLRALVLLLAACTPAAGWPAGIPPEQRAAIYRELQAPVLITLANRRCLQGHSIRVAGEQIIVGTSEGAGEAIFTFQLDEIGHLEIPGESYKALALEWMQAGETEKALELFELLYQQRVNMIPLLPPSESHFFIYYAQLVLQSPKPARAIGITAKLRPQIENSDALAAIDDAILQSYHQLELHAQAVPLAQQWVVQREPYGSSALGYYVLGCAKLRDRDYESALDLALQPIVFASPLPTENLAHCYAVAIGAAIGLREPDYAQTLFEEMQAQQLPWPQTDRTLQPYHKKILQKTNRPKPNSP